MSQSRKENEQGQRQEQKHQENLVHQGLVLKEKAHVQSKDDNSCIIALMRNDRYALLAIESLNSHPDTASNLRQIDAYYFMPEVKDDEANNNNSENNKQLNGKVIQLTKKEIDGKEIDWDVIWNEAKLPESGQQPDEYLFWKTSVDDHKKLISAIEKDLKNPIPFRIIGQDRFTAEQADNSYTWAKKKLKLIDISVNQLPMVNNDQTLSGSRKKPEKQLKIHNKEDARKQDNLTRKIALLSPDEIEDKCVVCLIRNKNHALLVLQGIEKTEQSIDHDKENSGLSSSSVYSTWIETYDFLPRSALNKGYATHYAACFNNPIGEGRVRQREIQQVEETDWKKIWTLFKFKDDGDSPEEYLFWKISKDDYQRLREDINNDMLHPPSFKVIGSGRFFPNEGHNCFTWAKEKLNRIGISERELQTAFRDKLIERESENNIQKTNTCTIF